MKAKGISGSSLPPLPLLLMGAFLFFFFSTVDLARAQGNIEMRMNDVDINVSCVETQRLIVNVVGIDNGKKVKMDRQSVVRVHDLKRDITTWQTTDKESNITFCNIDFGDYEIEVSAVGYLTEQRHWHLVGTVQERKLEFALRRDPTAVDLGAADNAIPVRARNDARRAVDNLKSANFKEAQKRLERAYRVAPESAQLNFLLGFLYVELKDYEKAESFLSRATSIDPRRTQPLILLGRVQLQREHNDDARKTLEKAVNDDSGSWMAHNLLADAYLRHKEYEKAREQAQLAIDENRNGGSAALLVLGQALANTGRDKEGIEALNKFVQANPDNPSVPQVKALITQIHERDLGGNGTAAASGDLALASSAPSLPESAWGPPGVDDVKPPVTPGVTCPSEQVIDAAGMRVKQLVDNIQKFAAVEDMVHEQLDKSGNPITKETRKFNYVASIKEETPGYLSTDEYRNLRYGVADLPDHIATTGFVTLALIFHPDMRENFAMTCEGLGDWHGQPAWLVHFRQRDDKPNRFADYVLGNERYPMKLKGRAWITADNLQIVRIESDLVSPLPQLAVQHQIAEYGPVHFQSKQLDLWLPQSADIFLEMNRHRYHRRHSFDHYMLFAVNSDSKSSGIKGGDKKPPVQNP
ncbi:MAG TPA: tetratricopeptide repeat protein [Candidatus Sulfotelmatobacter sp.]|jgi:tetratricopeptide (TPR) repeat protein